MPIFIIAIFIAFLALLLWLKSPTGKGWWGEFRVKKAIGKTQPGIQYVINNLTIPTQNGKSSQIDHVLINPSGIFVIETKNYSGFIYGNEKQREWTQVLARAKQKRHFYNPLRQNEAHRYHLSQIVGRDVPLYTAIVFVKENASFVSAPHIYTISGLKELIREPGSIYLSPERQKFIYEQLMKIKETGEITKSQHIKNINETQMQIQLNICPRCGAELKQRNGKYGLFWGCSNYPNCKFTKQ